ncbi:hypothetical protein PI124_g14447 [Phytophthora idaei]|nr:hypothetical protein PI126_g16691 [Phytophthora idaei]KAG3240661.1 hypothetical protein PI124_g14447 [Phytophthora idaei]
MAQQEGDDDDQQKARHDQVGDHDVARATYETRVIIVETGTDETMAVIEEHDADGARRPASEEPQSSITGRHNADAASSGDEGRMNDGAAIQMGGVADAGYMSEAISVDDVRTLDTEDITITGITMNVNRGGRAPRILNYPLRKCQYLRG